MKNVLSAWLGRLSASAIHIVTPKWATLFYQSVWTWMLKRIKLSFTYFTTITHSNKWGDLVGWRIHKNHLTPSMVIPKTGALQTAIWKSGHYSPRGRHVTLLAQGISSYRRRHLLLHSRLMQLIYACLYINWHFPIINTINVIIVSTVECGNTLGIFTPVNEIGIVNKIHVAAPPMKTLADKFLFIWTFWLITSIWIWTKCVFCLKTLFLCICYA